MQCDINILCEQFGDVFEVVPEYFCSIFLGNLYCIITIDMYIHCIYHCKLCKFSRLFKMLFQPNRKLLS